jgi:hypothetical protein
MGGRRPLKAGAVRLLGKHDGASGRAFRRAYDALVTEYGPFTPLGCLEASRVAVAWVNLEAATRALEAARAARERGKGRRPSTRDVERAARRQGLADQSYSQGLDKLRALAGPRQPSSLGDALARDRSTGR